MLAPPTKPRQSLEPRHCPATDLFLAAPACAPRATPVVQEAFQDTRGSAPHSCVVESLAWGAGALSAGSTGPQPGVAVVLYTPVTLTAYRDSVALPLGPSTGWVSVAESALSLPSFVATKAYASTMVFSQTACRPLHLSPFPWKALLPASMQTVASSLQDTVRPQACAAMPGIAASLDDVHSIVAASVEESLGSRVEPLEPLMAAGLDSLSSLELRSSLQVRFGVDLPSTLLFDHPNVSALSRFLTSYLPSPSFSVSQAAPAATVSLRPKVPLPQRADAGGAAAVVVSSIAARRPAMDGAWAARSCDGDASVVVPPQRWDADSLLGSNHSSVTPGRFAALLGDGVVSGFDAEAFKLSAMEGAAMDPQQRLLSCTAHEAICMASLAAAAAAAPLQTELWGIFVGLGDVEYSSVLVSPGAIDASVYHTTSLNSSIASGRLSYTFGCHGPSLTVNTACSSSLVCVSLARTAVSSRHAVPGALASGVFLVLSPQNTQWLSIAGMLAPDGRCKALDAAGDGYVRGEACVVATLQAAQQPLSDFATALLAGTGVNQDGRSSSLTAPHGPSQQDAVAAALEEAAFQPDLIGRVALHGTGTALGDPIETGALQTALDDSMAPRSVLLQACKTRVGHSEAASGIFSLLESCNAMSLSQQREILHLRHLNPHVAALATTNQLGVRQQSSSSLLTLTMPTQGSPWSGSSQPGAPAAHGVSAFGYSGTNAHVLVLPPPHLERADGRLRPGHPYLWRGSRLWAAPVLHPLLTSACSRDGQHGAIQAKGRLCRAALACFWDHIIQGQVLFPGAGYMEAADAISQVGSCQLTVLGKKTPQLPHAVINSVIPSPLIIARAGAEGPSAELAAIECLLDPGTSEVRLTSCSSHRGTVGTHFIGRLSCTTSPPRGNMTSVPASTDTRRLQRRRLGSFLCSAWHPAPSSRHWAAHSVAGVDCTNRSLAVSVRGWPTVNPAALDSSLQLGTEVKLGCKHSAGTFVPASLQAYSLTPAHSETGTATQLSTAAHLQPGSTAETRVFNHVLLDTARAGGGARLLNFTAKKIKLTTTVEEAVESVDAYDRSLLQVLWQAIDPTTGSLPAGEADPRVQPLPDTVLHSGLPHLLSTVEAVIQQGMAGRTSAMVLSGPRGRSHALGRAPSANTLAGTAASPSQMQQSGLWGLVQTAAVECTERLTITGRCGTSDPSTRLRLGSDGLRVGFADAKQQPPSHVKMTSTASSVVYRAALVRSGALPAPAPHCLTVPQRGTFDSLRPQEVSLCGLRRGEVVLKVEAVGINFRDVLNVLGMYPGDPGPPGADVAGSVVAVGPGVEGLAPGQPAFGVAVGCLGSHVLSSPETLVPLPSGVPFRMAAAVPTVFVTVDMAMRAAGAQAGQSMLVHGAAGGVGLAAVQVAHDMGLRVVATAGSVAKRVTVRSMGVSDVVGSRSTAFVEACAVLHPDGVDFLINSLTSAGMVAASISTLACGGCLVELSKRDIWSLARATAERPDLRHQLLAMDFLPSALQRAALLRVSHGMATGRIRAIPGVVHSMSSVHAALRQMSQARHIGKVITAVPGRTIRDAYAGLAITGGMGMLGRVMAQWALSEQRVSHVFLLGRSAARALPGMTAGDYRASVGTGMVSLIQCDCAFEADLSESCLLLPAGDRSHRSPPLCGIIHGAGVLSDATLPRQTAASMRAAFGPKAKGAVSTERRLLSASPATVSVLFSSTAALLGSPGQASYAAANSCLDGLAAAWASQGKTALSVQWGPWGGGGMALQDARTVKRLERGGMGLITASVGVRALEGCLSSQQYAGLPQATLSPMNWSLFLRSSAATQQPGLEFLCGRTGTPLDGQGGDSNQEQGEDMGVGRASSLQEMLQQSLDPVELVHDVVSRVAATVIGSAVDPSEPLFGAGLDSLGAVELRNSLTKETGLVLPATLLFDFSTVDEVTGFIGDALSAKFCLPCSQIETPSPDQGVCSPPTAPDPHLPQPPSDAVDLHPGCPKPLVVVSGITSRLPGSLYAGGRAQQRDACCNIPLSRWDVDSAGLDVTATVGRHAMLLRDPCLHSFDHSLFRVQPSEAAVMDPQQRLLLETTLELVADPLPLLTEAASSGVYVGIWPSFHHEHALQRFELGAYHATGSAISAAAGRLSYTFGMGGSCVSVDTACSASMVATHLAARGLESQDCQAGLAAGVNLLVSPIMHSLVAGAGMLSPDSRCKALDASADGYARAEACICLALSIAGSGSLHALASVRGSAVNQDGRSSSLTAPSGRSQQAVLTEACCRAGVKTADLTVLQLHSTGTALGDPIEVGAASDAVCAGKVRDGRPVSVTLQACKSLAGHTEAAAGTAALMYAFDLVAHQAPVGVQHLNRLNPYVESLLEAAGGDTALNFPRPAIARVQREESGLMTAEPFSETLVGSSSFAFQGTNGHLVSGPPVAKLLCQRSGTDSMVQTWERSWISAAAPLESNCLLESGSSVGGTGTLALEGRMPLPRFALLSEHTVHGSAVLPATAMFEAAQTAAQCACTDPGLGKASPRAVCVLTSVSLLQPMLLSAQQGRGSHSSLCCAVNTVSGTVRVQSHPGQHIHLLGTTHGATAAGPTAELGLQRRHGIALLALPAPRGARRLTTPSICEAARLAHDVQKEYCGASPWMLDACLHLGFVAMDARTDAHKNSTQVPASVEALLFDSATVEPRSAMRSSARFQPARSLSPAGTVRLSHRVQTGDGCGACSMQGLEAKPLRTSRLDAEAANGRDQLGNTQLGMLRVSWASERVADERSSDSEDRYSLMGTKSASRCASFSQGLLSLESVVQQAFVSGSQSLSIAASGGAVPGIAPWLSGAASAGPPRDLPMAAVQGMLQAVAAEVSSSLVVSLSATDPMQLGSNELLPWKAACLETRPSAAMQPQMTATRGGIRLAGEIRAAADPSEGTARPLLAAVRSLSSVLITGGLGTLGRLLTQWLVASSSHPSQVILSGRSARHGSVGGLVCSPDILVTVATCDLSATEDVRSSLRHGGGCSPALQGLLHTSGSLADATLPNQTASRMRLAISGKLYGALGKLQTLSGHPITTSALFSSTAALLGSAGQMSYAAANSALDAVSAWRHSLGYPGISIQWGPWAGGGMASTDPVWASRMARLGIGFISAARGLAAMQSLLGGLLSISGGAVAAVSPMNWALFRESVVGCSQMLRLEPGYPPVASQNTSRGSDAMHEAVTVREEPQAAYSSPTALPAPHNTPPLRKLIIDSLHTVAGATAALSDSETFMAAGLDSLGAVEMRSALQREVGFGLPATLVFDYPTLPELVTYLDSRLKAIGAPQGAPRPALQLGSPGQIPSPQGGAQRREGPKRSFILVRGSAAQLSSSPKQHLNATAAGTEVPVSRWDTDSPSLSPIFPAARHAALLENDVSLFDADAFGVSKNEAAMMDPQQRLSLEVAAEALQAPAAASVNLDPVGVFVGIWEPDYNHDVANKQQRVPDSSPFQAAGSVMSVAAGRISFTFGLKGPSMSIDTACSASLVGTHVACRAIKSTECVSALSLGANIMTSPGKFFALQSANMLSPTGHCKPLDAEADGYARGEAVVCFLLAADSHDGHDGAFSSLQQDRQGVQQHTVGIRGSAVNQDGRSSSLTAPHGPSQQSVIRLACSEGANTLDALRCIQIHGTGTPLGDPIELGAISSMLASLEVGDSSSSVVLLQAGKSIFGHCEASAGAVGLVCGLGLLSSQECSPILHLSRPNPHVQPSLQSVVAATSQHQGQHRNCPFPSRETSGSSEMASPAVMAGTSSFAYQGTNAHVVMGRTSSGTSTAAASRATLPWVRGWYWATSVRNHFILDSAVVKVPALGSRAVLEGRLVHPAQAFLLGHCVQGRTVLPGASFLEMAGTAVDHMTSSVGAQYSGSDVTAILLDCSFVRPLVLDTDTVTVSVGVDMQAGSLALQVGTAVHCRSAAGQLPPEAPLHESNNSVKIPPAPDRDCTQLVEREPAQSQADTAVAMQSSEGLASHRSLRSSGMLAHPASFDASLHLGHQVEVKDKLDGCMYLPAAVGAIVLNGTIGSLPLTSVALSAAGTTPSCITLSYSMSCPQGGGMPGALVGFQSKPARIPAARAWPLNAAHQPLRGPPHLSVGWFADAPCHVMAAYSPGLQRAVVGATPSRLVLSGSKKRAVRGTGPCLQTEAVIQRSLSLGQCRIDVSSGRGFAMNFPAGCSPGMPSSWCPSAAQASLWGLLQTTGIEHKGAVEVEAKAEDPRCLPSRVPSHGRIELFKADPWLQGCGSSPQPQAVLTGARYTNLLLSRPPPPDAALHDAQPLSASPCPSVAVTGGLGLLGQLVAAWLLCHGPQDVTLLSRSATKPLSPALCSSSSVVSACQGDASCRVDLSALGPLDQGGQPVCGLIHSGGILSDATIPRQTVAHMRQAFAPKVAGGQNCSAFLACNPVEFCSVFSSTASLLGSPGQASYSAANATLDGMAGLWAGQGCCAVSIQWGPWGGGGMASQDAGTQARMAKFGIGMLNPVDGIWALHRILGSQQAAAAACPSYVSGVIDLDWQQYLGKFGPRLPLMALPELQNAAGGSKISAPGPHPSSAHAVGQEAGKPLSQQDAAHTATATTAELTASILAAVRTVLPADAGAKLTDSTSLVSSGIDSLASIEVRDSLEQVLGISLPATLVFDHPTVADITRWVDSQGQQPRRPWVTGDLDHAYSRPSAGPTSTQGLNQPLPGSARVTQDGLEGTILSLVKSSLPETRDITTTASLVEAGLDSLGAVELRDSLQEHLGLSLPATLVYDHPTVTNIAAALLPQVLLNSGREGPDEPHLHLRGSYRPAMPDPASMGIPLVARQILPPPLVGIFDIEAEVAGCLPALTGAAPSQPRVPACRWDTGAASTLETLATRMGHYLDRDPTLFDAAAFGMSAVEAVTLDPQQRLLLATTLGLTAAKAPAPEQDDTGVFLGIWPADYYEDVVQFGSNHAPYNATGASVSAAAGRLSYTFGFHGPCVSIDTACSASLVGLHFGQQSVAGSECSCAVAAGVSMLFSEQKSATLMTAGMLSPTGCCKPMDASADGYARGEAVVCVLLRKLDEQTAGPGQGVQAVALRGSAVNQDGRSSSLTAPHGPSQQALLQQACTSAGSSLQALATAQTHGTGTPLGDPIEVGALRQCLLSGGQASTAPAVQLQAPKSIHSHSEAAAGLVAVLRSIETHSHALVPGVWHLRSLNPHVANCFTSGATASEGGKAELFTAGRQPCSWQGSAHANTELASVSSFAYQGTNCCVLTAPESRSRADSPCALPHPSQAIMALMQPFQAWVTPHLAHHMRHTALVLPVAQQPSRQAVQLVGSLANPGLAWLQDHAVQGRPILPGSCFMEACIYSTRQLRSSMQGGGSRTRLDAEAVVDIAMLRPLELEDTVPLEVVTEVDLLRGRVQFLGQRQNRPSQLVFSASVAAAAAPLEPCHCCRPRSACVPLPTQLLGASQSSLAYTGPYASILLPDTCQAETAQGSGMAIHPAALDCCLQTAGEGGSISAADPEATYVPSAVEAFVPVAGLSQESLHSTCCPQSASSAQRLLFDHSLSTSEACISAIRGFEAKPIRRPGGSPGAKSLAETQHFDTSLMQAQWAVSSPSPQSGGPALGRDWPGCSPHSIMHHRSNHHSTTSLITEALLQATLSSNLSSCGWKLGMSATCFPGWPSWTANTASSVHSRGRTEQSQVSTSGLWGLLQTASAELAGTVKLGIEGGSIQPSFGMGSEGGGEPSASHDTRTLVAHRQATRQVGLLVRSPVSAAEQPHRMIAGTRGTFGCLRRMAVKQPGYGEVRLRVEAVGINFRDVLNVLGMYPGDPGPPGADVAGVVEAVGEGAPSLCPGDCVFGLAPGCLGTHVVCSQATLTKLPPGISFEAAATVPTVFVTVGIALHAAGAQRGQRVLLHAAAGGIGLAAIQMARQMGLTAVATAGSAAKRHIVRRAGVEAVHDSRATDFPEELAMAEGVDIVLNSLTSAGMVAASLSTLRLNGCLVELSKRDIWSLARVRCERPDARYHLVAMDFLPQALLQEALHRVGRGLSAGHLSPLPNVAHSMRVVQAALRQMSQVTLHPLTVFSQFFAPTIMPLQHAAQELSLSR